MPDKSAYDVFLSHSAKDKAVVRPLAERLRADGMRRNSQPSTFNSQPPPGSDWAQLESGTFRMGQRRFRDPLNKERRFLVTEKERWLSVVEELKLVVSVKLQSATRLRQSILQKAFIGDL